jgi:RNA polymerase sigma-70 factor (ECF subfamily)
LDGVTDATRKFHALAWPLLPVVVRAARVLCRRHEDADDLAQETMLKAYKAIDQFRDRGNPPIEMKAWLLTILRHAWVDRVRASATAASHAAGTDEAAGLETLPAPAAGPADRLGWGSPEELLNEFSDQQVIDALQALPEEIRWTLLLVNVIGLDHEAAAAALGVPAGTVKSRAFRGRAMLRDALLPLAKELRLVRD